MAFVFKMNDFPLVTTLKNIFLLITKDRRIRLLGSVSAVLSLMYFSSRKWSFAAFQGDLNAHFWVGLTIDKHGRV